MSYQILSRKYRPQRFDELFGQEHVVQLLGNAVRSGRIGQAYLFVGPRGVGKTTTARILARALNCAQRVASEREEGGEPTATVGDGPVFEPCGTCDSCRDIAAGSDMDVVEMDAASNNHVDDVRALREQVGYATVRSRYRIWIVDEVHMLSTAAFNAFLKTLEEPPAGVKFFFCTTELHKLPETIRSRCIKVELRPVRVEAIVARLRWLIEQESLQVEDKLPAAIADAAQGGLRDAEALLEQLIAACPDGELTVNDLDRLCGRASARHVDALLSAIEAHDPAAALDAVDASLSAGAKPGVLLEQWLDRFRREMILGARETQPRVAGSARAIDLLLAKRAHVRAGADGTLVTQVAAVELARLPNARDVDALLDAVRRADTRHGRDAASGSGGAAPGQAGGDGDTPPRPRTEARTPKTSAVTPPPDRMRATGATVVAERAVPVSDSDRSGSDQSGSDQSGSDVIGKAVPAKAGPAKPRRSQPDHTKSSNTKLSDTKLRDTETSQAKASPTMTSPTRASPPETGDAPGGLPTTTVSGPARGSGSPARSVGSPARSVGSLASTSGSPEAPRRMRAVSKEPLDIRRIRAEWPELVADIATRDARVATLLRRCEVVDLRGDRVVLTVDSGANDARTTLVRGEIQLLFGQSTRRVMGALLRPVVDASSGRDHAPQPMDIAMRDHPDVVRVTAATNGRLISIMKKDGTIFKQDAS